MAASGEEPKFAHDFATAPDGGKLSYYTIGSGPHLLILHGSATYSLLHDELAVALSPYYTVHLASRRGRGLSSPYPQSVLELPATNAVDPASPMAAIRIGTATYTRTYNPEFASAVIATEVSDIETLVATTQAEYILGVSSGGLITLQTLLETPRSPSLSTLRKVAIMEPPAFYTDHPTTCRIDNLPRFERELASGDTAGAAITAMRVIELGPGWIPRWIMKTLARMMFKGQESDVAKRRASGEEDRGVCTMSGLTPVLRYDFALVEGMIGESEQYRALSRGGVEIMLLSGGKSPAWMQEGISVLASAIAGVRVVVIEGVGHELTCNAEMRGQPAKAVPALCEFFQEGEETVE